MNDAYRDAHRFMAGASSTCCSRWLIALLLTSGFFGTGCASYQVGTRTMFPPDVQTVYVPIFESASFRRNLGERLTEAVVKEIEKRTPFKVVGAADADSILSGKIIRDAKVVRITSGTDEPRMNQADLQVAVSWVDRRGDLIREQSVSLSPQMITLIESGNFVPEVGQSVATGQQDAINDLARRIVDLMETPW